MKKYILHLLLIVIVFHSCKNDNTPEEENFLNVYYTNYTIDNNKMISQGDTFTTTLDMPIYIRVETTFDNVKIYCQNDAVEIVEAQNSENVFFLYTQKAGLTSILVVDESTYEYLSFNLEIAPAIGNYTTLNLPEIFGFTTTYTIDINDESLKNDILTELENHYTPKNFQLAYASINAGKMEITMEGDSEPTPGLFSKKDDLNFTFDFNEKSYEIRMTEHETYAYKYFMKTEFTQDFREKYPLAGIKEITVTTLVSKNGY